jgi:hypothetical protein
MTEGALRYGIAVLARSERRLIEATLQSLARLLDTPDAIALVFPKLRAHQFADVASSLAFRQPPRLVMSENGDALPLSDAFRAMAPQADVILFVPEGVVLDPSYLARIRDTAERWQDVVGEIDVVDRAVDADTFAGNSSAPTAAAPGWPGLLQSLRPKTLCAHMLWVRVEVCGNVTFMPFPQSSEYLAFSFLLDQLSGRGRTRVTSSGAAMALRTGPERRSGFEAGRELYRALSHIGEWRDAGDLAFAARPSCLDPRSEKIMLFGEQMMRYVAASTTRAHVGSFIRGMLAARREATTTRDRIRNDIRKLR